MSEQWKLVPVEPTVAMRNAHDASVTVYSATDSIIGYRAMLAAAPQPPAPNETPVNGPHPQVDVKAWNEFQQKSGKAPALGGEVEVLAWRIPFGPAVTELAMAESMRDAGHEVIELVDHAHVARLQTIAVQAEQDFKDVVGTIELREIEIARLLSEVERLLQERAKMDRALVAAANERDNLKARTAALEALLRRIQKNQKIDYEEFTRIDAALAEGAKS